MTTVLLLIAGFVACVGLGFLLAKLIRVGKKLDIVEIPNSDQGRRVVADILRERKHEIDSLATPSAVDSANSILRARRGNAGKDS